MSDFSLLSIVDYILIEKAQWVVRQFELFTEITRKKILTASLKLFQTLLLITIMMILTLTIFEAVTDSHLAEFMLLVLIFWWKCLELMYFTNKKIFLRQNTESSILPEEIVSRKRYRKNVLRFFCMTLFLLPLLVFVMKTTGLIFVSISSCVLILLTYYQGLIEYLLCTTSLPPGEKEKRRKEEGLKDAVPEGAA